MVDLRAEVEEEWSERDADECEAWVRAFAEGAWRTHELSGVDRALCAFAAKLTETPGAMAEAVVGTLLAELLAAAGDAADTGDDEEEETAATSSSCTISPGD